MERIAIIDDEPDIRDICRTYFEFEGYEVLTSSNGQEALDLLEQDVDLFILDIMMPEKDGYAVIKEMKARQLDIPYIYLTAKTTESDTIYGLMLGADDYVKKPFSPRELVIRAKNILSRTVKHSSAQTLSFGALPLDNLTQTATINNETITLRIKEFDLLWYLATHENVALSKTDLLEQVWGYDYYEDMNTLNVHIHRLRDKLEQHHYKDYIISTVWGLGYKFHRGY